MNGIRSHSCVLNFGGEVTLLFSFRAWTVPVISVLLDQTSKVIRRLFENTDMVTGVHGSHLLTYFPS